MNQQSHDLICYAILSVELHGMPGYNTSTCTCNNCRLLRGQREQQTLNAMRAQLRAMVVEEERVTDDTTNAIGERECGVCGSTLHDLYNCTEGEPIKTKEES